MGQEACNQCFEAQKLEEASLSVPFPPGFDPNIAMKEMDNRYLISLENSIPYPPGFDEPKGVLSKDVNTHVETRKDEYGKWGDHDENLGDDYEDNMLEEAKRSWECQEKRWDSHPQIKLILFGPWLRIIKIK